MPRVTHVKRAQQRYETVPVLDDEGRQVKVPKTKNGQQMTTSAKRGSRPIFIRQTREDRTRPKPLLTCDYCRKPIEIGTPYKHISPKSGPYGGRQLNRHETCPTWQVWEYSSSLSARLAKVSYDFAGQLAAVESADDVTTALSDAAEAVREIAQEKEEAASNMEEGFGHETEQSTELADTAQQLNDWADEIENADVPEYPEPEPVDRWYVVNADDRTNIFEDDPEGYESEEDAQARLDEYLEHNVDEAPDSFVVETQDWTPDEPTEEQIEEWRTEVESAVSIVDESPV